MMPAIRFGKFSMGLGVNYDGWWNWGKVFFFFFSFHKEQIVLKLVLKAN